MTPLNTRDNPGRSSLYLKMNTPSLSAPDLRPEKKHRVFPPPRPHGTRALRDVTSPLFTAAISVFQKLSLGEANKNFLTVIVPTSYPNLLSDWLSVARSGGALARAAGLSVM